MPRGGAAAQPPSLGAPRRCTLLPVGLLLGLLALLVVVVVVGAILKIVKWAIIIALVVLVVVVARGMIGRGRGRKAL